MLETPFFDAHTHHLTSDAQTTSILSCSMMESASVVFQQAKYLSVSLHPWYLSAENLPLQTNWMEHCLSSDPRVVAVGEAGLDKLCDVPLPLQQEAFQAAIALSEKYRFPLLIHAVKATTELLAFQKKHRPTQPWIIHGFRGKKELAEDLLRHGFYLSFGKNTKKKPCLPCRPKSYWWKAMKKISISPPSIPKSLPYAARLWRASSKPSTKMLTVSFLTAKNWLFRESVVLLLQLLNKYVKLRISFDEFCR